MTLHLITEIILSVSPRKFYQKLSGAYSEFESYTESRIKSGMTRLAILKNIGKEK